MRRALWCLCLVLVGLFSTPTRSDDRNSDRVIDEKTAPNTNTYFLQPFALATQPALKQSVFLFGGQTNSGNLGNTFRFGIGVPSSFLTYDNYIVGGAYQRDFLQFNSGFFLGAEVGLADRFGHLGLAATSCPTRTI